MVRSLTILTLLTLLAPTRADAADLIMSGGTMTLGGEQTYDVVSLTNGATINVPVFNGTDRVNTGNLVIHANSITIDATSKISAKGSGYQERVCNDGAGPAAYPLSGGRGGCSLYDSGGGGAHFGSGGRGTKDISGTPSYPHDYEEACNNTINAGGTACTSLLPDCRNNDGLPTVAGQGFFHSIWATEFGAAGGDKGCRDGDGFAQGSWTTNWHTAGNGGGRIVLAATNAGPTGVLNISGTIDANGNRGCGHGNDSGGGGAGGTVLLIGDTVTIGATAIIKAAGGRGGDTQLKTDPECLNTQMNGTCDDCGGGGGGGIVNVMSRTRTINVGATFNVAGAFGGVCPICTGEAGGGAGELQIDGAYVGEICDGYDNDFDGVADNGFVNATCGQGLCATSISTCTAGAPPICAPANGPDASCKGSIGTARPRVSLLLDTSASMLRDLPGTFTFGDGSSDHPGIDTGTDMLANDSRLYYAKQAVGQLISAYPEIDFALSRYHQDEGTNRSCQTSKWLECQSICCTYDNPNNQDTMSPTACSLSLPKQGGGTIPLTVYEDSTLLSRCINYAGNCGAPRRGADILVGFESDVRQYMSWVDGRELGFNPSAIPGNYCGGLAGDCELRGTGPTPIAESLRALYDYVTPIQAIDPAASCRGYSVILVSDGAEECGGNPTAAAAELLVKNIKTYVIGVSVDVTQAATLNAIAVAGGTPSYIPVNNPNQLLPALVTIVSGAIHTELCNGVDDNCNLVTDEGYNVGAACDNGLKGICRGTGVLECDPLDSKKTRCHITVPGQAALPNELCNNLDDDCDGFIDEGDPQGGGSCGTSEGACEPGTYHCLGGGLVCVGAIGPHPETCNGVDDDCNTFIDDCGGVMNGCGGGPCGSSIGECSPGTFVCMGMMGLVCDGATLGTAETCNGHDDDCNGAIDDNVPGTGVACTTTVGGTPLCKPGVVQCLGGNLVCQGGIAFHPPVCTCPPDDCSDTSLGNNSDGCPNGSACIACACRTPCGPSEFPCSGDFVCRDGFCVPPNCGGRICTVDEQCVNDMCVDRCLTVTCSGTLVCKGGLCVENNCYGLGCPAGQICQAGACVVDPCTGVTCGAGEFCREGACVKSCAGVACPQGQQCTDGVCEKDPCGAKCASGQVCNAATGKCVTDPCLSVTCAAPRVCQDGQCVDDECAHITCPGDASRIICKNGQCVSATPQAAQQQVVAGGGGGFACAVAQSPDRSTNGSAWAFVAVAALFGWRRRRSRRP